MLIQLYKQAYSGLSRNSWCLCLVMFINRSGTMVLPFLAVYCTHKLHFTYLQAGDVLALYGMGSILGAFIGGKITDKLGFYDLQVFALLTGGIFFILLGFQTSFAAIATGTFILSMCNESFRPANSTALAYYSSPENKTRSYSLNRLAINLGWAFGGAIGGLLASVNYHLLFWVDGCTNITAAVMLLLLIPRFKMVKHVKTEEEHVHTVSSPYRDKMYLLFILLTVMFATCFFQLFTMQPVFYKEQWHFSERFIGALMALNGVIIVLIEMVIIHNLEGKRHSLYFIIWGVLLVGMGFVILNIFPAHKLTGLLVILFITFGEIMAMPFMNSFWIARTTDGNRGQYAALYTMAWSAAQVFGPYFGSRVINTYGFAAFWWLLGGLCLGASLGFVGLYRYTGSHKTKAYIVS